jgi:hypothetical protein
MVSHLPSFSADPVGVDSAHSPNSQHRSESALKPAD